MIANIDLLAESPNIILLLAYMAERKASSSEALSQLGRLGEVRERCRRMFAGRCWRRIESRIETKAALELDIQECRRTLRELEEQTQGVRIVERANGTFAVLLAGAETGWTVGRRPPFIGSGPAGNSGANHILTSTSVSHCV